MSIERNTLNFIEALNRDQAMQERMKASLDGAEDPRQTAVDFAAAEGYQVTPESMDAVKKSADARARLSDEELGSVAGGINPQPEPPGKTSLSDRSTPISDAKLTSTLLRW